jgi:hypothetical protein
VWLASKDPSVLNSISLPIVGPKNTASLPVTITPTGPAGSTDSGVLYVDDANLTIFQVFSSINGNEVVAIPYSFKVG